MKDNSARILGISFLCINLIFIVSIITSINGFGPIDDHVFIKTLFQGRSFGYYIEPSVGRFLPLTSQEYSLAAKLLKPTPSLFYGISALKTLFSGLLLFAVLATTRARTLAIIVMWMLVMYAIGFANASTRLQVAEINILVLILTFLYSTLILERSRQNSTKKQLATLVGIFALSTTLFYKELTFVFLIVFCGTEIFRRYRQGKPAPLYFWILLVVGLCYIACYLTWYLQHTTNSYAKMHHRDILGVLLYYMQNDPFVVFVVTPLVILRLPYIIWNKLEFTIFDSMILASFAYFFFFLLLGMANTYYLLPAYGFGACGVLGLLTNQFNKLFSALILFLIALFTLNNMTVAIADMQRLKLISNNHYFFIKILSNWLASNPTPSSTPRNLVLAGVSSGCGAEIFVSLKTFLLAMKIPESAFSIKATEPSDNKLISSFYHINEEQYQPQKGDLVILNPYRKAIYLPSPYLKELYHSEQEWGLPRWNLLTWTKFCVLERQYCKIRQSQSRIFTGYTAWLAT